MGIILFFHNYRKVGKANLPGTLEFFIKNNKSFISPQRNSGVLIEQQELLLKRSRLEGFLCVLFPGKYFIFQTGKPYHL